MTKSTKVRQTFATTRHLIHDVHVFGINIRSREIYLHSEYEDDLEEEPGVDYRMASSFLKNLNILNSLSQTNILIQQMSMGGDWNYGISIYDALMASPSPTTILAHAWSRSMSSITVQGCDKRVLMPNTDFMVHLGSIYVGGACKVVYSDIEECKKADEKMLKIYASRCIDGPFFKRKGSDEKEIISYIRKYMDKKIDWWITAEEAVDYGFADGILGQPGFETIEKIRKTKKNRRAITSDL